MKISSVSYGVSVLYDVTYLLNNNCGDNGEILKIMFDID